MGTETRSDDGEQPGSPGSAEREAQELVERLRSTPAEEIVAEQFSALLSTAQVKLGRRDARLFIDLCAQMLDYAGPYLTEELGRQVATALGQLRLAQVSAESEVAKKGEPERHDLSRVPTPPPSREGQAGPEDRSAAPTSKLWVPGR